MERVVVKHLVVERAVVVRNLLYIGKGYFTRLSTNLHRGRLDTFTVFRVQNCRCRVISLID